MNKQRINLSFCLVKPDYFLYKLILEKNPPENPQVSNLYIDISIWKKANASSDRGDLFTKFSFVNMFYGYNWNSKYKKRDGGKTWTVPCTVLGYFLFSVIHNTTNFIYS